MTIPSIGLKAIKEFNSTMDRIHKGKEILTNVSFGQNESNPVQRTISLYIHRINYRVNLRMNTREENEILLDWYLRKFIGQQDRVDIIHQVGVNK